LQTSINAPKQWLREVDVEIEPGRLESKVDELLVAYRDRLEIPGFRPGKAPRSVVLRRLGEKLESAAVEDLVRESIVQLLEEHHFHPIDEPRITDLQVKPDRGISIKLRIEVLPEFELKDYRGLKLRKQEPTGFDDEFEKRLRTLQDKCATFRAVDRPAAEHDYVMVDYRTIEDGHDVGKPKTGVMLEVGDPMSYEQVNARLTGTRPGDEVEAGVEVTPEGKGADTRKVTYRFSVREVKEKVLPEVSEEFARDLGFDDMDALRRDINDQIVADRTRLVENGLKNQVFDFLTREHDFEPPDSWVQASYQRLRAEYRLPDDEETRSKLQAIAAKWARFDVLVARIAEAESLSVTEDEITHQVEELARGSGRAAEEIAPLLDNPSYRNQLLREKVLGLIVGKAEVS